MSMDTDPLIAAAAVPTTGGGEPPQAPAPAAQATVAAEDELDVHQIGRRVEATFIGLEELRAAALTAVGAYIDGYKQAVKDGYVTEELLKKFNHPDKRFGGAPGRRGRPKTK